VVAMRRSLYCTYKVEEEVVVYKMWKKETVEVMRFGVNE
jgi:hypothetical protein